MAEPNVNVSQEDCRFPTETIQERLALRNYLDELRGTGVRTGGPEAIGITDRKRFADQLDRFLAKQVKG